MDIALESKRLSFFLREVELEIVKKAYGTGSKVEVVLGR